jgi:anti-sigma regulatory factor (Ser/Thr protein kinase)
MSRHKAKFEIILTNCLAGVEQLAFALDHFCNVQGLSDQVKNQVNLVLEELYTNTVNYGFEGINDGRVVIALLNNVSYLEIVYQDNGIAYNPLQAEDPELLLSVEDRPIGGLGVFFVKTMTDHVEDMRDGGFNIIKMTKNL